MTGLKSERDEKTKIVVCSSSCAGPCHVKPALGEAVLWVADFDSTPVAGSYQADEAQQVGKRPGYICGVVTTCKAPSTNLLIQRRERVNTSDRQIYTTIESLRSDSNMIILSLI